ncbi:MAG: penicillin-binding protein 2 [Actinomycetota bacterium]|nr:penicillin-binding protein 2 [Actinomycetota bacterium]
MTRPRRRPATGVRSPRGSTNVRLRVAMVVIVMVVSIFGARLFQLQGIDPKAYAARAAAAGMVTVPLPAARGKILDRNGVPLAESVAGLMIVADPLRTMGHAQAIAKILADRLGLDYFNLLTTLTKPHTRFQYVARRVPSTLATGVVNEINQHGYLGITTASDPLREYPANDVGANLLGFMGSEGQPMGGLELAFDKLLGGRDGTTTYEVGGGNRIPLGENSEVKPVNGKNLRLTIDRDVQWYAQRVLRSGVQAARADSGAAVVLDTRTGELLALADYPSFDPNHPGTAATGDLGSRALSNVYEPGSVEKVLTVSSLMDAHKVLPSTKITVPSQLKVMDRVIHDYFVHPTLRLTMAGVIAKSSNIGTTLAASQFQPHRMWRYLSSYGLGQNTDIGVPGESAGLLPQWPSWTKLTRSQVAFGQGVSVNALQMATAVNAVANQGQLVTPSLVLGKATTTAGNEVGTATAQRRQVVGRAAASMTEKIMEMVTTQGAGTAPEAGIAGYRVAGKTGTAEEVGARCKCYNGTLAVSFAGFAPADNPRFTVYIVLQHPRIAHAAGGWLAGPIFRKILAYVLQKYAVPPTGTPPANLPMTW